MVEKIVFSDRAIISLLAETQEHTGTETGGVFLGYRCGKIWYVIETMDPGPNSTFETAFFEYDNDYLNHLMNKVSRLYKKPLDIVGLWHRHPGSFDKFSGTDDVTNLKYAKRDSDGAISALVNIDPSFRLTVYHVDDPLDYKRIDYIVGDRHIPKSLMSYAKRSVLVNAINNGELEASVSFLDKLRMSGGFIGGKDLHNSFADDCCEDNSFSEYLARYLESPSYSKKANNISYQEYDSDDIERMLESLEADLNYFSLINLEIKLSLNNDNEISIVEGIEEANDTISVFVRDKVILIRFKNKEYKYYSGLFKDAAESLAFRGVNR